MAVDPKVAVGECTYPLQSCHGNCCHVFYWLVGHLPPTQLVVSVSHLGDLHHGNLEDMIATVARLSW